MKSSSFTPTYPRLLKAIVETHSQALNRAVSTANQMLVLRNWFVGAYLVEFQQHGKDRAKYGERLLEKLAADLSARGIKGLEIRNLRNCRLLYLYYPQIRQTVSAEFPAGLNLPSIRQAVSAESGVPATPHRRKLPVQPPSPLGVEHVLCLSWSKLVELVAIEDPVRRAFYENECIRSQWSVRQLQRQIGSLLYERTGLSKDKRAVVHRARNQDRAETVEDYLRDPYLLEFAGLAERAVFTENDLETGLLNHLQAFLLELGAGFCFEARQKRITIAHKHDYIDLVFYHRLLRCHVLLDLKVRPFRHADAGQMNFYLNWWKSNAVAPGDSPPVGILVCSDRDHTEVEFATAGMDNRLFVSRYLIALPSPERLRRLIEADRAQLNSEQR